MTRLPNRQRNVIQMPTPQSVEALHGAAGASAAPKKKAKSVRDKPLNTLVSPDLHQSLRQASVRLGRSMGRLIEEAWALHPENTEAK